MQDYQEKKHIFFYSFICIHSFQTVATQVKDEITKQEFVLQWITW